MYICIYAYICATSALSRQDYTFSQGVIECHNPIPYCAKITPIGCVHRTVYKEGNTMGPSGIEWAKC